MKRYVRGRKVFFNENFGSGDNGQKDLGQKDGEEDLQQKIETGDFRNFEIQKFRNWGVGDGGLEGVGRTPYGMTTWSERCTALAPPTGSSATPVPRKQKNRDKENDGSTHWDAIDTASEGIPGEGS